MEQEITNHQDPTILGILMQISGDMGEVKSDMKTIQAWLKKHVEDDQVLHKASDDRLKVVEDSQKKVKWMAAGASAVITGAAVLLGWIIDIMWGSGFKR